MWSSRSSAGASDQAAALVWPWQVILQAASNLHYTERKLAERLSDGKKQAVHIERLGRWRQAFISKYLQASERSEPPTGGLQLCHQTTAAVNTPQQCFTFTAKRWKTRRLNQNLKN